MIDGELRQPQRFFAGCAQGDVFPGGQQSLLKAVLLAALPEHDRDTTEQDHRKQQTEVLPEAGRLRQSRVFRLQPLVVQLLQIFGRDRAQSTLHNAGQLRPIAARADSQQLRQADIAHHHQFGELRLYRQPPELCLVDHGVGGLLRQQQLQGLTL
ncbi:hypothetical protein D3C81_1736790 [compost metagenome]